MRLILEILRYAFPISSLCYAVTYCGPNKVGISSYGECTPSLTDNDHLLSRPLSRQNISDFLLGDCIDLGYRIGCMQDEDERNGTSAKWTDLPFRFNRNHHNVVMLNVAILILKSIRYMYVRVTCIRSLQLHIITVQDNLYIWQIFQEQSNIGFLLKRRYCLDYVVQIRACDWLIFVNLAPKSHFHWRPSSNFHKERLTICIEIYIFFCHFAQCEYPLVGKMLLENTMQDGMPWHGKYKNQIFDNIWGTAPQYDFSVRTISVLHFCYIEANKKEQTGNCIWQISFKYIYRMYKYKYLVSSLIKYNKNQ